MTPPIWPTNDRPWPGTPVKVRVDGHVVEGVVALYQYELNDSCFPIVYRAMVRGSWVNVTVVRCVASLIDYKPMSRIGRAADLPPRDVEDALLAQAEAAVAEVTGKAKRPKRTRKTA
jgi:hypothetical protein